MKTNNRVDPRSIPSFLIRQVDNHTMTTKRDTSSAEYLASLANSLRWDDDRAEPYIQLPSFPDLRLTLFRQGIEDQLVCPYPVITRYQG